MKKKYILMLASVGLTLMALISCNKNDVDQGDPVIKYVRPADVAEADALLTSANMGETIVLVGEHLGSVNAVYFNDVQAQLNPNYVTSANIIVDIPNQLPSEFSNTITVKTSTNKEYVYSFVTKAPAPTVSGISCEWARIGDTATVTGTYFFNVTEVLFAGNAVAEVIDYTSTEIKVIVPQGALQGQVAVTTEYGTGRSSFIYKDDRGIFIDGENQSEWNWWNRADFGTDGGIDGGYVWLHTDATGSWTWPADAMQLLCFHNDPMISANDNPEDYVLRFELKSVSWMQPQIYFWFDADGSADIDGEDVCQYIWKPFEQDGTIVNYVTDWVTVTIPISQFNQNKYTGSTDMHYTSGGQLVNFYAFPFGDVATSGVFDIRLDNVRLIKIK
ncbi:MAG: glycan-binding surface protein [Bacteroidales bacterium]|jgi:hypothetical protein|nr:glycan-binding surface protein [Bacteroidales bacterium]